MQLEQVGRSPGCGSVVKSLDVMMLSSCEQRRCLHSVNNADMPSSCNNNADAAVPRCTQNAPSKVAAKAAH
eukprot:scaffold11946_cov19-Tisochrysis_lutea.AAC.5